MTVNLDRATMLLHLIELQAKVAPRLTNLSSVAHSELLAMDEECKAQADAVAERKAREQVVREAEARAIAEANAPQPHVSSSTEPQPVPEPVLTEPATPLVRRPIPASDQESA